MKRILIIGIICGAGWLPTKAQSIAAMTEQLAALQALEQTIQEGYRLVTSGLQTIGGINDAEYQLHSAYFGSLSTVKPALTNNPKVIALQALQQGLIQQLRVALDYWRKQPSIQQ